jgi:hypothetical protein
MLHSLLRKIKALLNTPASVNNIAFNLRKLDDIKLQNGKILALANKARHSEIKNNIHLAEFKVFSEWGDDGIIQFLVDYLEIDKKIFIEFGVENYEEANTRFLLINNNWKGLVMDGSEKHMQQVKDSELYWRYNVTAVAKFITAENINGLFETHGFTGGIGLLHIDIDGNDYWTWKTITTVNPQIVIMEYNSVFGFEHPWTVPYDAGFHRTAQHPSNLYFGSSLLSLCDLAEQKGYGFIGCNSSGNNAYFVRQDKLKDLKTYTAAGGYVMSQFRESRDKNDRLTFISENERLTVLKGMKIFNTRTNREEQI